ncbi:MAG TPA: M3 family oligoendopeptidase [Gemmatimonadales bacterium]|nr:M3 family oligoendopeptidase [Gemmatimonadales bacterium]
MKLPESSAELAGATWDDCLPYYEALAGVPLDPASLPGWLADWSRFESALSEAASLAMIAYTCDTTDPAKEAAHLRFSTEILPKAEEQSVRLARRLVETGLVPEGMETTIARFKTSIDIFREENVPLFAELEEMASKYQRITGGMMAEWEGEQRPLPMLSPFLQARDRTVRERAFRATVTPYVDVQPALSQLFDSMYAHRQQVARQADFRDFQTFSFAAKHRFDYTPGDCERFHDAVDAVVVPAYARVLAARRQRLGLEALRPWDIPVNPYRAEPLRPFKTGDQLARGTEKIIGALDPVLAGQFRTMMDEGLLDLDSRKGKAPGGYCDTLHVKGRPFIFMNASGVLDDLVTLLHEAGHAFHAFASHAQPLVWQRHPGAEAAELASMSMELLSGPHLGPPDGMLDQRDAAIARLEHLEDVLANLVHIASVDAFQSWIYSSGEGGDPVARDQAWLRIRSRFEQGVDWSGLTAERIARWYRQLHIFLYPFYYIEYGIAQLGALQVWRNRMRDGAPALEAYRNFLALGATRPLPDLYRTAGAQLVFDAVAMRPLIDLVEEEIDQLRGVIK